MLDVGCGEGKNDKFFAKEGFQNIEAFDISEAGIGKLKRITKNHNIAINGTENDVSSTIKKYYPDSSIYIEAHYSGAMLDSLVTCFPSGIRSAVIRYKNGLLENNSDEFYANETLKSTVLYRNGIEVYHSRKEYDSLGNNSFE
ncbi:MAG: hypothetical protein JW915_22820 [Chitinispirillaceae bacterium]|nr:hypothetical protein [Chitinispirillaceae bacterium]